MVRSAVLAFMLILAAADGAPAQETGLCVPGASVGVLYGGDYYAATALEGPAPDGTCLVTYEGYPSTWDEWVSPARLRVQAAGDLRGAVQETPESVPEGRYNCYRFGDDGPQYIYMDLVIGPGSRYSFVDREGRFKLRDNGEIQFGGPMAEAKASLEMMLTGTAQINLKVDLWADEPLRCSLAP